MRIPFSLAAFGLSCLTIAPTAFAEGDPVKGEAVFRRCAVCHGIGETTKPVGPNLNGVIGRVAGTQEEFVAKYSQAMKDAGAGGLVWTEADIDEYITDPKKKIPGNKMAFPGVRKPEERADVIAYIKQFSEPTAEGGAAEGDAAKTETKTQ